MARKHTPGPWRAVERNVWKWEIEGDGFRPIATVAQAHTNYDAEGVSAGLSGSTIAANARLIAAAPDLLAALNKGLRLYERELLHLLPSKEAQAFLTAARAASAKAKADS